MNFTRESLAKKQQLGDDGKEGKTYLASMDGKSIAVKTFKTTKSSAKIVREADFQKKCADADVAPNVYCVRVLSAVCDVRGSVTNRSEWVTQRPPTAHARYTPQPYARPTACQPELESSARVVHRRSNDRTRPLAEEYSIVVQPTIDGTNSAGS